MDRETIIRMAEEAGLDPMQDTLCSFDGFEAQFTKFAQLVAAHEREQLAKLAESIPDAEDDACCVAMAFDIAFNIRART